MEDGWFPFIEIMGSGYDELASAYAEKIDIDSRREQLVGSFDDARLTRIISKWWKHPIFKDKKPILEAATKAYQQNDEAGFINCIKNLSTEIEGILRIAYRTDKVSGRNLKSTTLIDYVIGAAKTKAGEDSLFLPEYFLTYLKDMVFAHFDGDDQDPGMNRNTSNHGVAKSERYTRTHALQLILTLDQIYFYTS